MSDIVGTKISQLPLGENLADDDLMLAVEDGTSKKVEIGYLKNRFVGDLTLADLGDDSTHRLVTDAEKTAWSGKQDALTFDNAPTNGSSNPVKSSGIYTALGTKANTSDLATVATSGSYTDLSNTPTIPDELADLSDDSTHRLVTDAEKNAWNGKQNALTFDDVPAASSNNPVKSGGIYTTISQVNENINEVSGVKVISGWVNDGNFYHTSSGRISTQTSALTDVYHTEISCVEGDIFTINAKVPSSYYSYLFSNNDGVIVSDGISVIGLQCDNRVVNVPTGATKLYINKRASITSKLSYYNIAPETRFEELKYLIETGVILPKISDNIEVANLFDKNASGVHTDGYYDRNNTFQPSTTLGQTDYIRVMLNQYYYTPTTNVFVLWFDKDKALLGNSNFTNGKVFNTSATYAKFIFLTANINDFYVKCDNIYKISSDVSKYTNMTGVAFGTSLTYRSQSTGGYLNYLPNLTGMVWDNQGIGNATILVTSDFPTLDILAQVKSYTGYSSKDVCILEGFVNDFFRNHDKLGEYTDTAETTVCGCVRSALNYILGQNPDITVFLVLDHYGTGVNASTAKNSSNMTQYEYYSKIAKVAESMGVPVIEGYKVSGMNEYTPDYFIDNIHPTATGAEQFANTIFAKMENISVKVQNP